MTINSKVLTFLEWLSKELGGFRELCLMARDAWAVLKQSGLKCAVESVGFRVCDKVMEKERVPSAAAPSCLPGVGKGCAGFQGRSLMIIIIIIMLLASSECFSSLSCSGIIHQHVTGCWQDHPQPTGFGTGLSCLSGATGRMEVCMELLSHGSWGGAWHGLQGNPEGAEFGISALN